MNNNDGYRIPVPAPEDPVSGLWTTGVGTLTGACVGPAHTRPVSHRISLRVYRSVR